MSQLLCARDRRRLRVRSKLRSCGLGRLRLSVAKTNRHIYLQLVDDSAANTLVYAGTNTRAFKQDSAGSKTWCNIVCAKRLGDVFSEKALSAGIALSSVSVVFDRGGSRYTGIIGALADCLRGHGWCF